MLKIGGAFVLNWANRMIGCARIERVLIKLTKVGGAIAPPAPPVPPPLNTILCNQQLSQIPIFPQKKCDYLFGETIF